MTSEKVHLLLRVRVPEFIFNPERKDGIVVVGSKSRSAISIKPVNPKEDGFGHRLGVAARVTRSVSVAREQFSYVQDFISRRVRPYGESGLTLPLEHKGSLVVDGDGHIQKGATFWYDWLPDDIRQIMEGQESEMWSELLRFLRLLRWHQNEPFPLPEPDVHSLYWRTASSGLYHSLPSRASSFSGPTLGGIGWQADDQAETRSLWRSKTEEPLAHELRSESALMRASSPRSALLMAASALEVGVKAHIGRLAPVAEWLVFNVPSPPIFKVLRDYLPIVHASNTRRLEWAKLNPLFKRCQAVAEDRNKLSHAGYCPEEKALEDHLTTVTDVLYMLDYLEGHDWVVEHVSSGTRIQLGWPPPRRSQIWFSVSSGPSV